MLSVDGILEARVHLNIPPVDPLFGRKIQQIAGSASVLLVREDNLSISIEEVASLVSGASGIDEQNIRYYLATQSKKR